MSGDLRMDAYYYGFEPTGVREIDMILSAVATAGKAYHHTEWWTEPDADGHSQVDYIQRTAKDAAAEVGRLRADLADAQQRITGVRAIHSPSRPTWNQPVDWCAGCGHDYPCPTIAALSTGGTDRTGDQT